MNAKLLIFGVIGALTACNRNNEGFRDPEKAISYSENREEKKPAMPMPIPLAEMLKNGKSHDGKVVSVICILVVHKDGPWISADPTDPVDTNVDIIVSENSKLITPANVHDVWWFSDDSRGYPAIVTGTFWLTGESGRKRPFLEVSSAEVDAIPYEESGMEHEIE